MDAVADCKDTLLQLAHTLREKFIVAQGMRWLVVEGDAKLYATVKSLKFEYGEELSWMIPYPGDFHLLMNYQKALMKPYFDAGLKSLAQAAGYPVAAIQSCSQFQRTHRFILEAWEAIYRVMLLQYIQYSDDNAATLLSELTEHLQLLPQENFSHAFNVHLESKNRVFNKFYEAFSLFIQASAQRDDTWRFYLSGCHGLHFLVFSNTKW